MIRQKSDNRFSAVKLMFRVRFFQKKPSVQNKEYQKINNGSLVLIFSLLMVLIAMSCSKNNDFGEVNTGNSQYIEGDGVFVLNEGNFGQGNGSLSFLNLDSLKIGNEIFSQANGRPLGDVPFSMLIIEDEAWIVVNNSAKIEVVKLADLKSVATIEIPGSPRFIAQVSPDKLYVSDFSSPRIFIIDLQNYGVEDEIVITGSAEQMVLASGRVFVAFWSDYHFPKLENNRIFVIDPENDVLVDSVMVGKEPNSMVLDKNGKLWVLCSGGYLNEELPSLWRINPENLSIEQSFQFSEINSSPTSLCTNGTADTLYFLNQGIFRMSILDDALPESNLIHEENHLFYALSIHPESSCIFATDAIDYQQRGLVLRYTSGGTFQDSFRAGIIPGRLIFNMPEN